MVLRGYNFVQTIFYSFGTSTGWALAIIIMAAIKEKLLLVGDIPPGLRGPGITMIIAGLLAFAFMVFPFASAFSFNAALAAASLAIGTLNGEQET